MRHHSLYHLKGFEGIHWAHSNSTSHKSWSLQEEKLLLLPDPMIE